MIYYLNKIAGFAVSPLGGTIAGIALSVLLARVGRRRLARWTAALTVAWAWLWLTPAATWLVGVPLEREFLVDGRVPPVESCPAADAIVVLGGGMGFDTNFNPYAEMSLGADRVWQGARLFKAGKAPRVVATGVGARESSLALLTDLGVDESAISFLDARNTEEEARAVARLGFTKIVLVTSAWHMRRARMMFAKYAPGLAVVCAPADYENLALVGRANLAKMLLPDVNALQLNSASFREWVGLVGYWLFR
ncbi:MAG: YdcF family protein [Kiritimatiellae bacterium]|nr:YdcF family protein [Kiritimatiellia bacterium]